MAVTPTSLPSPGVRFSSDLLARIDALHARLRAPGVLLDGARGAALLGAGEDFAGYRPYRPGEDLRQLDWSLYARLEKPFVRVTEREAGESWAVLLDASASMGVGPPGKLQRAAECAAALVSLGLRRGARVTLIRSGESAPDGGWVFSRPQDQARAIEVLESSVASGSEGLGQLLSRARGVEHAGRVYLCGDLLDLDPLLVLRLRRGGRALFLLQLLAPEELEPGSGGRRWWDPEEGRTLTLEVGPRELAEYERQLSSRIERWRSLAARHGLTHTCHSTRVDFEDAVRALLGGPAS